MAKHQVTMTEEGLKNFFIEKIELVAKTIEVDGAIYDDQKEELATTMRDFTLSLIEANQTTPLHDNKSIFVHILKWLYTHDGAFHSASEWRTELVALLEKLLVKDNQK